MCTSSVIIERGKRLSTDLEEANETWVRLRLHELAPEAALPRLLEIPGVTSAEIQGNGCRVRIPTGDDAAAVLARALVERKLLAIQFQPETGSLEDLFMHVTKGNLA